MKQSEHLGANKATESKSNRDSPTGAGRAAAGGAAVGGGLASTLCGAGLAIAGTAVAIPASAVIGVGIAAGAALGGLCWLEGLAVKKAINSR